MIPLSLTVHSVPVIAALFLFAVGAVVFAYGTGLRKREQ